MAKSILFYSKVPMNYAMFAPMVPTLAEDGRVRLAVHADPGHEAEYEKLGLQASVRSGKLASRWRRHDLYVSADMRIFARRARIKAHIFHGISFKGKAFTEQIRRFDRVFLIGPYQRRRFAELGLLAEDDPRMVDVGMPKTDRLARGEFRKAEVLGRLGLPADRPVVLYAPTWRRESSLNAMGEDILRELGRMDATVLVKLHDWCWDPSRNARDWGAWFAQAEASRPGWTLVRDPDITPYLGIADVLVSDASSAANEFLLRNRPVVFIDVPALIEKYAATADLDTWGRKTGVVVGRAADLRRVVEEQLRAPDSLASVRCAARDDYFYNAGCATPAALREIHRLLEIPEP